MLKQLQRFLKDESGTAAVEYGLLSAGIAAVIIPAVKDVGMRLVEIFSTIQSSF